MHVHHVESKATVCSVYVKQWLNCAAFFEDDGWYARAVAGEDYSGQADASGDDDDDRDDSDDEDVWRKLDEAANARSRKEKRAEKVLEDDGDFSESEGEEENDDGDGEELGDAPDAKRQKDALSAAFIRIFKEIYIAIKCTKYNIRNYLLFIITS